MLGQSFKITKVAGIPLLVHWTFGFFFFWIAFVGYRAGMDQEGIFRLCLFAFVLFVCVVLHELGHAFTARRYGIETKDIIISPIGGVARLFRMPKKPKQELIIAIAGPAVNLLIAIFLAILLTTLTVRGIMPQGDPGRIFNDPKNFLPALFWVNVLLIIFNLVPAFPMDGGRIFRALLSMKWGRLTATKVAARLGQFLAVCFVLYGLWDWDLILVFIGLFVFMSAAGEYRSVYLDSLLSEKTVADLYRTEYTVLNDDEVIHRAIELHSQGIENDFLVVDGQDKILGVLTEESIQHAKARRDYESPVGAYLARDFRAVTPHLSLKSLVNLFQKEKFNILPVFEMDHMVGVVDRVAVSRYLQEQLGFWNRLKN